MSIESVMPSNHPILCCPLLLLPSIFPSTRVFSNGSALRIRWPNHWRFSISPSNEYSGLISFRTDWFDVLAVQETPHLAAGAGTSHLLFGEVVFLISKRRGVDDYFPSHLFPSLSHTWLDHPVKNRVSNQVDKWTSQAPCFILRFLQFLPALDSQLHPPLNDVQCVIHLEELEIRRRMIHKRTKAGPCFPSPWISADPAYQSPEPWQTSEVQKTWKESQVRPPVWLQTPRLNLGWGS